MKRKNLKAMLILALCGLPLYATVVPALTLEQLVERSDMIVQGRCLRTWSAWDAQSHVIWTHSEIEIRDTVKGGGGSRVVVSEPGGIVDGVQMSVAGMPRYRAGEEVVLFLYRTPIGLFRARGVSQGKFAILNSESGGPVVRSSRNATVVQGPGAARGTPLSQVEGMPLAAFKLRVRQLGLRGAAASGQTRGNR